MNFFKKHIYKIYIWSSIIGVIWILSIVLDYIKFFNINYKSIFFINIIFCLLSIIVKICNFIQSKKVKHRAPYDNSYLLDVLNMFVIVMTIIFISSHFFHSEELYILATFLLFIYMFYKVIKFADISLLTFSTFLILIFLSGWINSEKIQLIAIASIILNTITSIDNRINLVNFLKNKGIGPKLIQNQNMRGNLTYSEIRGKFIAQKVLIYIIVAIISIILDITENKLFISKCLFQLSNRNLDQESNILKIIYKGVDRIFVFVIFFFIYAIIFKTKNVITVIKPEDKVLNFYYIDKYDIEKKLNKLKDYLLYNIEQNSNIDIKVNFIFDTKNIDNSSEHDITPSSIIFFSSDFDENKVINDNVKNKIDKFKRIIFRQYTLESRLLLLPKIDYPLIFIKYAAKSNDSISNFSVKINNKNYKYDDLLSKNPGMLHYRTLYEILKRTEYESLEGAASSYSLIGKDNKKYKFDDNFNDKIIYESPNNIKHQKKSNYYLVDDEINYFTCSNTRYLTFEKLKEIIGYEFTNI